jgi:hypothetical protein
MSGKEAIVWVDENDPVFQKHLAGASVSWVLVKEVLHEEILDALKAAQIQFLPEPCSPASALHRLMMDLYAERSCIVRPAPNPNGTKKPAYAVLPRQDLDEKMAFVQKWVAGLDTLALPQGGTDTIVVFSADTPPDAREDVEAAFPDYLQKLGSEELSVWLVSLVKGLLGGVPVVGGSGSYFVAPEGLVVWRRLKKALEPFGIRAYEIPAMKSSSALEAIVDSVRIYVEKAAKDLEADLIKYKAMKAQQGQPGTKSIQQRVLDERMKKITDQLDLVEKYESLLDTSLGSLREDLGNLQVGFGKLAMLEMNQ